MSKIDTKNWKEFRVWELFQCDTTFNIPSKNDLIEWDIPYVTRSSENNWLSWYCWNIEKINEWNCITIWAEWFFAFYQKNDFVAWNKVYTLRHNKLNKYNAYFLISCLNVLSWNYSFNNARVLDKIEEEIIKLPINKEWNPDREYMENYMKNLEKKCKKGLELLKKWKEIEKSKIDTNLWKEFKVWDLFEISSPNPRSQNNYEDWEVPFVASWDVNNWILKYCKPRSGENLDIWNCITVSPVDWSSFYQENDFLGRWWAGSSIMILRNKNLHKYCWLFVAWIIRKCCNFTYNDMWNREKLKNLIVKFPVDSEWNPNRDFMENYIKNLMEKNRKILRCLN